MIFIKGRDSTQCNNPLLRPGSRRAQCRNESHLVPGSVCNDETNGEPMIHRIARTLLPCIAVTLFAAAPAGLALDEPPDAEQLLKSNVYTLSIDGDGRLTGPGADLILREAARSQFVMLGEIHNVIEMNRFATALFERLHREAGYEYLILEQGPVFMERLLSTRDGTSVEEIERAAAAGRFLGLHFYTDQEFQLMSAADEISDARQPVRGVDRELELEPTLLALIAETSDEKVRHRIEHALHETRQHNLELIATIGPEKAREKRMMVTKNDALDALLGDLEYRPGSRGAWLVDQLRKSRANLRLYQEDGRPSTPWGYSANLAREQLMMQNFAHFLASVENPQPKALVKMGHWHVSRGENPSHISTLGTMMDGVARLNDLGALAISVTVVNQEGQHVNITDYEGYETLKLIADHRKWQILDLRPLRDWNYARKFEASDGFRDWLYKFDLLLLLGNTHEGTYAWVERALTSGDVSN